jgi:dihydrofolate reductase
MFRPAATSRYNKHMRKVIFQMMITVDGKLSGPNGELDWIAFDEDMGKVHMELAQGADAAIVGSVVYQDMARYWPAAEKDPKLPENERAFARQMNRMPKIVLSDTEQKLNWQNAQLLLVADSQDVAKKIQALKQEPGGYLIMYGGVQTARTFVQHDLIDEYRFDICPVILGEGKALFDGLTTKNNLKLVSVSPYPSGAITATYQRT